MFYYSWDLGRNTNINKIGGNKNGSQQLYRTRKIINKH